MVKQVSARETDIPNSPKTTIFRILQEVTNNTLKHGGADLIRITLSKGDDETRLIIEDNGNGFDNLEAQEKINIYHFGVAGMRQRARRMGGSLVIKSTPGAETRVVATWPDTICNAGLAA